MRNDNGHLMCPNQLFEDWQYTADFWYDQAFNRGVKLDAALEENNRLGRKIDEQENNIVNCREK